MTASKPKSPFTTSPTVEAGVCPSWCETDHSNKETPCWGIDARMTLTRMLRKPGPGQDKYETLSTYLEQKPDGTTDLIVSKDGPEFLTLRPQEAARLAQSLQWFVEMTHPSWPHPFRNQ
jgi:hypothetical protein